MTPTDLKQCSRATPASVAVVKSTFLWRQQLCRGVLALAWATVFGRIHQRLDSEVLVLLVAYPMLDAVSSSVDYLALSQGSERRVTAFNAMLSLLAAIALGAVGRLGAREALATFGVWAAIAGAAQFLLGLRRRGPELGRQLPMLISGGLSTLVGVAYCVQAAGAEPSLGVLAIYATGGGTFFIIQAGLQLWRSRDGAR